MQQIWRRFHEERIRPRRAEVDMRGRYSMDRSKAFLVLATVVVLSGFAFLALFSTSGAEGRARQKRTQPSLGKARLRDPKGCPARFHRATSERRPIGGRPGR